MSNSREKILKKIKEALEISVPLPFPEIVETKLSFPPTGLSLKDEFEQAFTGLQGEFYQTGHETSLQTLVAGIVESKGWTKIYCKHPGFAAMLTAAGFHLHNELESCDVCITDCEALVSRTGTIVLSSAQAEGRTASVYAPAHLCIAFDTQLQYDLADALSFLQTKYGAELPSFISFASGPSRTADIEKTLVTGVHGPKEVTCVLVKTSTQSSVS